IIVDPAARSNKSSIIGNGCASLIVIALIPLQSTTWRLVPSFFGTKKHGAAIGDVEGHIMPASSNSLMVSLSSCCLLAESQYLLDGLGSLSCHPSIKLILKFQIPLSSGIDLAFSVLKTSVKSWYSTGTPSKSLFLPGWWCSKGRFSVCFLPGWWHSKGCFSVCLLPDWWHSKGCFSVCFLPDWWRSKGCPPALLA